MEYIKFDQYENRNACRPPCPHPNGLIGNKYTADLIAQHIDADDDVTGWISRIANLRFVRLPDSTKERSTRSKKRAARQDCYLPVGEPQLVSDFVARVAKLPPALWVQDHDTVAYKDLWWDCQGGHCPGKVGVEGRPYIQFLPPNEPDGE